MAIWFYSIVGCLEFLKINLEYSRWHNIKTHLVRTTWCKINNVFISIEITRRVAWLRLFKHKRHNYCYRIKQRKEYMRFQIADVREDILSIVSTQYNINARTTHICGILFILFEYGNHLLRRNLFYCESWWTSL